MLENTLNASLKYAQKLKSFGVSSSLLFIFISNYLLVICPCEDGEYLQWCCQVLHLISVDFCNFLLILEELLKMEHRCYS